MNTVGQGRLELPTSRLSGVRSNHLSYWPDRDPRWASSVPQNWVVCHDDVGLTSRFVPKHVLRKEVIQPQVPLRLPCYDFTPVTNHSLGACLPCGLAQPLLEQSTPMV
jgi:hypothetical protein